MAKHGRRTKIRGAQPTVVKVDEIADGMVSYKMEVTGNVVSLPLELARAWAQRGAAAADEFICASTAWALFKPEAIAELRKRITRARSQATYWHGQAATR